jgi:hypothetical protein
VRSSGVGSPSYRAALRCAPVVLTVAVVIPVASGIGAVRQTGVVPAKLVGTWTRTVSSADVKRTPGGLVLMAGHVFTLNIAKSGSWTVACKGLGGLCTADGNMVPAGADRVRIIINGEPPALYGWRVSGRLLTLTKLKDAVPDRRLVMWGIWKRK